MSYFLPSFLQKRLLRYALSRIELVDTDALDLDSLDIKWGQRSTFELKDINLRLEKLAAILRLPPSFNLTKAVVSFIHVTIPADIYSSPILIEVDGVDACAMIFSDINLSSHSYDETSAGRSLGKALGFESTPTDDGRILPSTIDLAQSFLDSGSKEGRAEMKAAISSQSQMFQKSGILEEEEDDEVGLGIEGVSLPSFVAGFFKGIISRLQLTVKNVRLSAEVELSAEKSIESNERTTAFLKIQDINVKGEAFSSFEDQNFSGIERHPIYISHIYVSLLADQTQSSSSSPVPKNPMSKPWFEREGSSKADIGSSASRDAEHSQSESSTDGEEESMYLSTVSYIPNSQVRSSGLKNMEENSESSPSAPMGTTVPLQGDGNSNDRPFTAPMKPKPTEKDALPDAPSDSNGGLNVNIESLVIDFDAVSTCLLGQIYHLINAGDIKRGEEQNKPARSFPFNLNLERLSIRLISHYSSRLCAPKESISLAESPFDTRDIIVQLSLDGIRSQYFEIETKKKCHIEIYKFAFGSATEDVLRFNKDIKIRNSTRDISSPTHGDISVDLELSPQVNKLNISTLPMDLMLHLPRLDDTLSWFGGLSSILELGNSIASLSTTKGKGAETQNSGRQRRGVHSEPESSEPLHSGVEQDSSSWKVNSRIGGFIATLTGEQCSVKFETTAVKIVSRTEGIGLQVDRGQIGGPLQSESFEADCGSALLKFSNIRCEYLFSPKEADLDRLVTLLTPSKDKYDEDDDIMLDTLVRQRQKSSVLRVTVEKVSMSISDLENVKLLSSLSTDLAKLSTVTKYLPEDDRPGVLTLVLVGECDGLVDIGGEIGDINFNARELEAAHVGLPSLLAGRVTSLKFSRNDFEELVNSASPEALDSLPMIMVRYIAGELEPTIRIKLYGLRAEYTISSIMAFLGIKDDIAPEDIASDMTKSVLSLTDLKPYQTEDQRSSQSSDSSDTSKLYSWPSRLSVTFRDCICGLNPRHVAAKGLFVINQAKFKGELKKNDASEANFEIQKASILVIDDVQNLDTSEKLRPRSGFKQPDLIQASQDFGYVPVCYMSSAAIKFTIVHLGPSEKCLDVEIRDDLLVLETCADSTQTLVAILNGLALPSPPNKDTKYRTEVIPLFDMLNSLTGDELETDQFDESREASNQIHIAENETEHDYVSGDLFPSPSDSYGDLGEDISGHNQTNLESSIHSSIDVSASFSSLNFDESHFSRNSVADSTVHRWDSKHNEYCLVDEAKIRGSPLRVRVRDVHVIWNLFDGYDWSRTRDTISKAVKDVQTKEIEKRYKSPSHYPPDSEEEEEVVGDFLFNSIYIDIPANRDPRDLSEDIDRDINDLSTETGSYATSTTVTQTGNRTRYPSVTKTKKLRLARGKRHKMTFELKGISADHVAFPPGSEETQSSLDVRIRDFEIFDHLPTSTWKKFATYLRDAGERETGADMIRLLLLTVKPVADLAASEFVLKLTTLPLRLHVDQDALDFLARFFEFRDESQPTNPTPGEYPFIQRAEIDAVRVRLDFKPKRIDYGGLRSGRTTEFMNFFILDEADMILRRVILYGVVGFDKLGQMLNDIWMPDVKATQLPGVLAGLAPIKSVVGVGSGFKDLVFIPMKEYQKDGRVFRSIQRGTTSFAKKTTNEFVKLGAKLAVGTQAFLQTTETFLNQPDVPGSVRQEAAPEGRWEDASADEDEKKHISLYADQPVGVAQGLRGGYSSLERDLLMARDAVIAVPGEVMDTTSAGQAAKAVLKRAPTMVLRPAIGASKAIGQTLLGVGNTLDPENRRRMEDKYKRH